MMCFSRDMAQGCAAREECPYCQEFERGYFVLEQKNLGSRIINKTDHFLAFPSLGPLREGHVLIAPKEHIIGMSGIPEAQYDELEEIFKDIKTKIAEEYGNPIFFEHGDISMKKRAGSCIQHAHFHGVPANIAVVDYLNRHFKGKEINQLAELQKQTSTRTNKQEPYLFLEEKGRRYVFSVTEVLPSQYLRQVVAVQLGTPTRWDWRTSPNLEEMLRTRERLGQK